ncbi:unnamed protein product [Cuscuta campestris]|uniref:Cyclin-dependent kinase inhibitor domain-containing protein n=1 Tax=Cuscuta campestris TaxID=132261 RepID=A0A484MDN4_9ASTE|nr:unnamed protein product [Cuscuta campestris]
MGKHMREAKIAGDVAVIELPQPTIGVRTRARILALLRRQSSAPPSRPVRVSSGCSVGSDGYDLGMEASSNGSEPIQPRDHCLARREANEATHSVTGDSIVNLPSRGEMDEFFVRSEQQQQALFIDKYNYDIVNDLPLPGRYDWVKVSQ